MRIYAISYIQLDINANTLLLNSIEMFTQILLHISIANLQYSEKRRMSNSIETTKYIQKLIKIIYEKEKTIELMKKQARDRLTTQSEQLKKGNTGNSVLQEQIQQQISCTNMEVKTLIQKMNLMETKINELTTGLTEQINQNIFLQRQTEKIKQQNKLLILQLDQTTEKNQSQKQKNQSLKLKYQYIYQQNCRLQSQNQRLKDQLLKAESNIKIFTKSLEEYRKLEIKIGESINTIYSTHFTNQTKDRNKAAKHIEIAERTHDLENKLDQIGQWVGERKQFEDPQILNETLEGLSIIMKSFEEKLEGVNCLTERQQQNEIKKKATTKSMDRKSILLSNLRSSLNELKMKYTLKENTEWTN